MKKALFFSVVMNFIFFLSACNNSSGKTTDKSDTLKKDTNVYDITRPIGNNFLEDLLNIKDEAELKSKFGTTHISYDTIWGEEGMFTMGSFLDEKTKDEVEFMWGDSLHRSGVENVAIEGGKVDAAGNYTVNFENKWVSKTGVKLGLTTDELEKMNGKPFVFSGFGWDLGGGIYDWSKGKFENCGIGILLSEGDDTQKLPEKELDQILGDHDVRSDNAVIKKIQPKVIRISVYKPQ
jgi:hypothetical protein